MIRGLFIPYYDHMLWAKYDYSQIEYRLLAHFAKLLRRPTLANAYLDDPDTDFHQLCADLSGADRPQAKNVNFAKVYGGGIGRIAAMLEMEEDDAREFVDAYEEQLPDVSVVFKKAMNRATRQGQVKTWGGRIRRFRQDGRGRRIGTHSALNAVLQGSAADLLKRAMAAVQEIVDWESLILHLTVHDELDFSMDPGEKGVRLGRQVQEAMEDFQLEVPVKVDVETGPSWGAVTKDNWLEVSA